MRMTKKIIVKSWSTQTVNKHTVVIHYPGTRCDAVVQTKMLTNICFDERKELIQIFWQEISEIIKIIRSHRSDF